MITENTQIPPFKLAANGQRDGWGNMEEGNEKKKHIEESPDIGMDLQFLLCKSNSPNTCSSLGEADNIICRQHNFILSSYGAT